MLARGDDETWRIDPTAAIAPQIRRVLRERIVRCELRPDQRISEAEIAARYGVSRQPVREAFIRLAEEELLVILPQRGTAVRRIALAEVRDARFLREAFESDVVRVLARDPDPARLADLRAAIELQTRIADGPAPEFMRADDDFHRALAVAAGKGGAWRRVQALKSQMDRVRYLSLDRFQTRRLIDQHARIVEAVAAGDAARAEAAMRAHLRGILDDLPHIVAAHPEVFDAGDAVVEDRLVHIDNGGNP